MLHGLALEAGCGIAVEAGRGIALELEGWLSGARTESGNSSSRGPSSSCGPGAGCCNATAHPLQKSALPQGTHLKATVLLGTRLEQNSHSPPRFVLEKGPLQPGHLP